MPTTIYEKPDVITENEWRIKHRGHGEPTSQTGHDPASDVVVFFLKCPCGVWFAYHESGGT